MTACLLNLCSGTGWILTTDIQGTEPERCPCGQAERPPCPHGVCDGTGVLRLVGLYGPYEQRCECAAADRGVL